MTAGTHGWPVSRPALALRGAGLHETLLVSHRHTQLTQRTVASSRAKHTARFRATPQLSERGSKPFRNNYASLLTSVHDLTTSTTHRLTLTYLCTADNPPVTVTGVTVFSPLCSVYSDPTPDHTRTSGDWEKKQAVLKITLQLHFTLSTFEMWKNLTKLWLWFIYVNTCIACPINQSLWCEWYFMFLRKKSKHWSC